ncbi:portal protein [Haloarcula hispanica tailed virus 2]|uniref:Portal protein n=1 Tax=Haloarcula hispanica tailed virus 2 TaxID=1273751 RepID=R4TKJ6_9CAUD|nr:portal protein [Haloarcula hispanica tailed virus 2]AGM11197.1 hypothetical protein HHTV2_32 [Haloarcula hispanica tailed virus 2]
MSRLDRLRSWVRPGDSDSETGYAEGHSPEDAGAGDDGTVQKQRARSEVQKEPQRRNNLPPELARSVRDRGAAIKPYDADWLQTLAENWVAQAYIDTMAQDLATAPWHLKPRDEAKEVPEETIAEAERQLQMLHPEKSFRDLREMAARNTLKLGDGAWVKHYDESGNLAEAIPVDSSRMYKRVNEHGLTEGYVEVSWNRNMVQTEWDLSEVVWFEWASREGHVYGQGPVEKGADVIEVLEELGDKELKDLKEGMPPGIVSVKEDEDTPMAVDSYEKVKSNWKLKEGERHRAIVSMGDWQFTPLDPGYQELQFMERNKLWIQSLGAIFKVNAPYAGFDFQEGNKAQNQAQTEAYKQRGFMVLVRQMEEAINRQLIWEDISEDLEFEFETVTSTEEQKAEAEYQDTLATAAEHWDNLGREVTLRDGRIEVEDGPVQAPDEPEGGGGPFGFSAEEQAQQAFGGGEDRPEDLSLEKAVAVEARMEQPGVPDDPEAMDEWHSFLESIVHLGGLVESQETGRVWPMEGGGDLLPPADGLLIHGVNATIVEGLLSDYDRLGYRVTDRERDRTRSGEPSGKQKDEPTEPLTKDQVQKLDEALLEAHRSQVQPESITDIDKRVWTDDDAVPEYVQERITRAIDDLGAVFEDIESVPSRTVDRLKDLLRENMTQPQGWSLDSIVSDMKDVWPGVPEEKLEVVARTETASVLNTAREDAYEDLPGGGDEPTFYWEGPKDSRTTDACEELKERTNADFGGDPVPMDRLVEIEREVQQEYFPGLSFRKHTVHPNERHTFVRAPASGVDWD